MIGCLNIHCSSLKDENVFGSWDCKIYNKMFVLQFGQKSVEGKDFYNIKRISNISTLEHDKIVVSKSIPCKSGKEQRYEVGYKDDEKIVPLYIKTPQKVFS